ncbi:sodium-coupled neutral amino acid transporter 7-like isoform X2 [Dysidea avara]|uniref:sodium-coupled neutral amino acid transporter 7-like isoform X2 n=1 Tax=Dysidea avara TaxID=196820 RepID=UPI0033207C49
MNINHESTEENIDPIIPLLRTRAATEIEDAKKDATTSPFGSIFVLINAALGAGLLAFPYAFWSSGGVAIALILEAVLIIFVTGSLLILAKGIDETDSSSFEGIISALCGRALGIVCQVSIALYCFGTTIAFLVIIGDQLVDVSSAFTLSNNESLSDQWYFDRKFSISVLSLIFIFPFLMLKNIGSLSYTSILGVVGCVYIAIIVSIKYFLIHDDDQYFTCHRPQPLSSDCHRSWMDVFNAIPLICFGYQCHISSVPIYAGLRMRSLRRYAVVVAIGIAVCVGVYSLTGTFGYLTFHGRPTCIDADILRNYCPKDIPVNVARVMLTICIITSYPILHFVGRFCSHHFYCESHVKDFRDISRTCPFTLTNITATLPSPTHHRSI